jgi:branched-chain amino acid transport system ATP-binding protein
MTLSAAAAREPVFAVEALSVRYGGVVALDAVTLTVENATVTGLIGPNGAGKTTFIDAVSGFAPYAGKVLLRGESLGGLRPHKRQRRGIARTFQSLELFDDLTVGENVVVGESPSMRGVAGEIFTGRQTCLSARSRALMEQFALWDLRDDRVAALSQGHRKLVTIVRALASGPKVLLLDEPAAGLDSAESLWLGEKLRSVRDAGTTVFLVDHDMGLVLSVCDYLYVLDFGSLIAEGPPATVRDDPRVMAAYLGDVHEGAPAKAIT